MNTLRARLERFRLLEPDTCSLCGHDRDMHDENGDYCRAGACECGDPYAGSDREYDLWKDGI